MSTQATAIGRLRGFALSPERFLAVALTQLFALWLIVTTGAAVRLTDSGLGCRHWPGCEPGHPLPAKDYHAFVEFGNRVVGGVTIAVTVLAWLAARRTPGLPIGARRLALAVFLGTVAQAPLGALAVATDLRWPIVAAHLVLSFLLIAGAVVLALEARRLQRGAVAPLVPLELRRLAAIFAGACLLLVVSGTLATAAGPHSGGGSTHVHRLGSLNVAVYAHAAVVAVFLASFLFSLGYLAAQGARARRLLALGGGVLALLLGQMALGDVQYRTQLPWGLVLVHVCLASTVWAGTVALATLFWRPTTDLTARA
jgi:cytochrome c oxidase assembly protein subunit 15